MQKKKDPDDHLLCPSICALSSRTSLSAGEREPGAGAVCALFAAANYRSYTAYTPLYFVLRYTKVHWDCTPYNQVADLEKLIAKKMGSEASQPCQVVYPHILGMDLDDGKLRCPLSHRLPTLPTDRAAYTRSAAQSVIVLNSTAAAETGYGLGLVRLGEVECLSALSIVIS